MIKKIMLIDDIDIANIIMKKMIHITAPETEVYDFTDPLRAYESIKTILPDLIFLDLNMPWLDGWQFLEKMRKNNFTSKVIIITSSTSILDKERANEFSNVVDYLEKPVQKDQILKHLNAPAKNYYSNLR